MVKVFPEGTTIEEMIEWCRYSISTKEKSYAVCNGATVAFEPVWAIGEPNSPYFKIYEVEEIGSDNEEISN